MLFAPLVFLSTGQVVAQSRKEEKDKNIKHATLRAYFHFLDKDCPLSESLPAHKGQRDRVFNTL